MPVICPKCSHVRPADATNPDWQCPSCGVCYAKVGIQPQAAPTATVVATGVDRGWTSGWPLKIALVAALAWGVSQYLERKQPTPADRMAELAEDEDTDSGEEFANAMLKMSGADIGMLASIVRGMEKACAHNPRGMSESECLGQLQQREDVCNTTIAQRFPGKIGDTGRLEAIALAYRDCIFEE